MSTFIADPYDDIRRYVPRAPKSGRTKVFRTRFYGLARSDCKRGHVEWQDDCRSCQRIMLARQYQISQANLKEILSTRNGRYGK